MAKRIHVVGSSPRTGTTLMVELLVASYEIDGHAEHEMTIFEPAPREFEVFCSKRPVDLVAIEPILRCDRNLWVINMVRDPRDIVVSRHGNDPAKYWAHLGIWMKRRNAARRAAGHPRFMTVRYEDLVQDPDRVQALVEERIPFLERKGLFRDFHKTANPSEMARKALGGVRPISTTSIGNWREHKPRLAAQLAIHGSIDQDLVYYGYEADTGWHSELEGIVPDNGDTYLPERAGFVNPLKDRIRRWILTIRYLVRLRLEGPR